MKIQLVELRKGNLVDRVSLQGELSEVIKKVIDSYEGKIPEPFYGRLKTAMYNYKVEIND